MENLKKLIFLLVILIPGAALYAQRNISLDECIKLALEHNQKIKVAQQQVKAANDLKKAAFTQYLPDFRVNGAYTYINKDYKLLKEDLLLPVIPYTAIDPATGGVSQAALGNPAVAASTFVIDPSTGTVVNDASGNPVFQKYTYLPASKSILDLDHVALISGGFTQPIYAGGKIREANKIAGYTKEIADYNLSLSENELVCSVEEAYWRIVSLKEKLKLAGQYREMLVRLVSDLENIYSEGIITDNDLLKARLKLSGADIQVLKAENGMELSKMALCRLTGLSYSSGIIPADSLNSDEGVAVNVPATESSIESRPELGILEKNIDIARSGVKLMESRFLPDIAMTAGYTIMNPNLYNGLAKEFGGDYTIGVVCNIPLFHFGDRKHTLNAARAEHEAASMKLEESKELMVLQLQQAIFRYNEAVKTTELAALALGQSSKNLKYTEDGFREGIQRITDLLEAQVLWQKAFSELIDARTEQQMAASNIKKLTGKY